MATDTTLKTAQTSALCRLTKCRTTLSALLLKDKDALDEVKSGRDIFDRCLAAYRSAHVNYMDHLQSHDKAEAADREDQRFFANECASLDFRARVTRWVTEAEHQLSEELTEASDSRKSRAVSSKSVRSVRSARAHEEAKIAELTAQSKLLHQKLALEERMQKLELQTQLEMAEARRMVFVEADDEASAFRLNPAAAPFKPQQQPPSAQSMELCTPQQHPAVPRPTPPSQKPAPSMSCAASPSPSLQQLDTNADRPSHQLVADAFERPPQQHQLAADAFEPQQLDANTCIAKQPLSYAAADSGSALPRQDTPSLEQLISTMSLPQGEVPTFSGECTSFHPFVHAFNARIATRTQNPSDLLYYLYQYVKGEPREMISSCLHLPPEIGYPQAVALLKQEYGDPYKISSSYIEQLSTFPKVRADDSA